jgi:hypothetical protein
VAPTLHTSRRVHRRVRVPWTAASESIVVNRRSSDLRPHTSSPGLARRDALPHFTWLLFNRHNTMKGVVATNKGPCVPCRPSRLTTVPNEERVSVAHGKIRLCTHRPGVHGRWSSRAAVRLDPSPSFKQTKAGDDVEASLKSSFVPLAKPDVQPGQNRFLMTWWKESSTARIPVGWRPRPSESPDD